MGGGTGDEGRPASRHGDGDGRMRLRRLAARVQHRLLVGAVVELAYDARVEGGRPRRCPLALPRGTVHAHAARGRPKSIIYHLILSIA